MEKNSRSNEHNCVKCKNDTGDVYIQCQECPKIQLCVLCFSQGAEPGAHLKTHPYIVKDNGSFTVFNPKWTASEERILLDSIEQYGLGNWEGVSNNLPNKTTKDIETYYNKFYVQSIIGKIFIPAEIPNRMTDHTPALHECVLSVAPPEIKASKEELLKLAYMPNRDDYEYEFDNEAEHIVCNLYDDADADDIESVLVNGLVSSYLERLKERQKRKDVCREYKLVDKFFNKSREEVGMKKHERELRKNLRPCSQFMKKTQFDKFIETLQRERQLKRRIAQLRNYRQNGITKREDCNVFDAAVFRRNKRKELQGVKNKDKLLSDTDEMSGHHGGIHRSSDSYRSDPLGKILSTNERQLCNHVKITPSKYCAIKSHLIKENIVKKSDIKARVKPMQIHKHQKRQITNFIKEQGWLIDLK